MPETLLMEATLFVKQWSPGAYRHMILRERIYMTEAKSPSIKI